MTIHRRSVAFFLLILFLFPAARAAPQATAPALPFTILLSNDDGYDAPGLRALIRALQPAAEIFVAAPASDKSGVSHSVTIRDPIMAAEKKQPNGAVWYAIEAPPATCVRLALASLMPRAPDLVITGINRGENLGVTVYPSGTVGAAREAAFSRLPAIAVSMRGDDDRDYAGAAAYVVKLIEQLRAEQLLRPGLFLNVNIPAGERKGVRITRLSLLPANERYDRRTSPRGRLYFWPVWEPVSDDAEGTDVWAFARGFISVTPLQVDATSRETGDRFRALERQASGF